MAGTTADKLNKLKETKSDIRSAMNGLGLDVTEQTPFSLYAGLLSGIKSMKKVPFSITCTYSGGVKAIYQYFNEDDQLVIGYANQDGFGAPETISGTTFAGAAFAIEHANRYTFTNGNFDLTGKNLSISQRDRWPIVNIGEDGVEAIYD